MKIPGGAGTASLTSRYYAASFERPLRNSRRLDGMEGDRQILNRQIATVDSEAKRLVSAITAGGDIPALVGALKVAHERRFFHRIFLNSYRLTAVIGRLVTDRAKELVSPTGSEDVCNMVSSAWSIPFQGGVQAV